MYYRGSVSLISGVCYTARVWTFVEGLVFVCRLYNAAVGSIHLKLPIVSKIKGEASAKSNHDLLWKAYRPSTIGVIVKCLILRIPPNYFAKSWRNWTRLNPFLWSILSPRKGQIPLDGAAGEIFSFRLQRASFLSVWEHLRQDIQASRDAVHLCGLVSANMDLFENRVRRPSVGPPLPLLHTGGPPIYFASTDLRTWTPMKTILSVVLTK